MARAKSTPAEVDDVTEASVVDSFEKALELEQKTLGELADADPVESGLLDSFKKALKVERAALDGK